MAIQTFLPLKGLHAVRVLKQPSTFLCYRALLTGMGQCSKFQWMGHTVCCIGWPFAGSLAKGAKTDMPLLCRRLLLLFSWYLDFLVMDLQMLIEL